MLIKKNKILFILIIILIGNVFAYTDYNSFLVGTISIVKDKKISADKIEDKFLSDNRNYKNNPLFEEISFEEYDIFNEIKCYQEDPKIFNNCGAEKSGNYLYETLGAGGLIYINYSKPERAIGKSLWQVKWGYDSSSKEPYYFRYSLPLNCWNQKELQFKIYSGDPKDYEIGGYCFNGYEWQEIFFESYEDNAEKTIKASPKVALDGDYSTGVFYSYYKNEQEWLRSVKPENKNSIYEEGMVWIFLETPLNYEKIDYKNNNFSNNLSKLIYLNSNESYNKKNIQKTFQINGNILLVLSFISFISIIFMFFLLKKYYKISKARKRLEEREKKKIYSI